MPGDAMEKLNKIADALAGLSEDGRQLVSKCDALEVKKRADAGDHTDKKNLIKQATMSVSKYSAEVDKQRAKQIRWELKNCPTLVSSEDKEWLAKYGKKQ